LIGVRVTVKSTSHTVLTDSLGEFRVICKDNDKLKLKADGFYDQKVKISKNIQLVAVNLKLKPGEKQREYAIGYGYVYDEDRTNAMSDLDDEDTDFTKYDNVYEIIRSMGVQVRNGEVIIRGTTSFQGSSAALIVVDDVIVDGDYLQNLSPRQVKSIDIIKDGSSAVYGSRGANGVVIIKTKKGGDL
jgi:TonB-dependent SusC/RagA subfamily outer membrane receptor